MQKAEEHVQRVLLLFCHMQGLRHGVNPKHDMKMKICPMAGNPTGAWRMKRNFQSTGRRGEKWNSKEIF